MRRSVQSPGHLPFRCDTRVMVAAAAAGSGCGPRRRRTDARKSHLSSTCSSPHIYAWKSGSVSSFQRAHISPQEMSWIDLFPAQIESLVLGLSFLFRLFYSCASMANFFSLFFPKLFLLMSNPWIISFLLVMPTDARLCGLLNRSSGGRVGTKPKKYGTQIGTHQWQVG